MSIYNLTSPFQDNDLAKLKAGDTVYISGIVYAARDAAHKRMLEILQHGEAAPFDLEGQTIYYMGPTPTRPGNIIGSCGPTTSSRMDKYTSVLLKQGLKAVIGKGQRSYDVNNELRKHRAVYFVALGGCGALAAQSVQSCCVVAYEDLTVEAILRLEVKNMQVIVALDYAGSSIF